MSPYDAHKRRWTDPELLIVQQVKHEQGSGKYEAARRALKAAGYTRTVSAIKLVMARVTAP